MHESSLVGGIIRIAEEEAQKHNVARLTRIVVSVGLFTCIDPRMLQECFAIMAQSHVLCDAELCAHRRGAPCHCEQCHHDFVLHARPLCCPVCGAHDVKFTDGYGIIIEKIEAQSV